MPYRPPATEKVTDQDLNSLKPVVKLVLKLVFQGAAPSNGLKQWVYKADWLLGDQIWSKDFVKVLRNFA